MTNRAAATHLEPFDMVVLGASGDLSRRMLLPSLYLLHQQGELAADGRILGVARQSWSREQFVRLVEESLREFLPPAELDPEALASFLHRLAYVALSATDPESYDELVRLLAGHEERARIFYLAMPPTLYGDTSRAIAANGLVTAQARIVLEKPIGHDLSSAQAINAAVGESFSESQIFRIDHYLGKETVQNLMALRFGNALFEPIWRSERIDHVQITVAETLGVEGRGEYYDHAGALRDMVQNHLLQLLCLVAMEPPSRLDAEAIRSEKIKVLQALEPIGVADLARRTVWGQYRAGAIAGHPVRGYLDEPEIAPGSTTETFVALKTEISNWRWAGVPFYLRTGKRMGHRVSEIIIQFKPVPHLLFQDVRGRLHDNRLVIRLQPDDSVKLGLMVKQPGPRMVLRRVTLDLNFQETFEGRHPLAYERLLLDVLRGNATLFMHRDEVEHAWRWVDSILAGRRELAEPPSPYDAGTWGPPQSIALLERDDRSWYEHLV